jgi:hypothetical protein
LIVINVALVVLQMLGYMFWFLIHCKAAWCDSNDVKKGHLKGMSSALFLFLRRLYTLSQFDKHLKMPRILRWHLLCVAVMHPKKIHVFCSLWPLCPSPWVLRARNHLTLIRSRSCDQVFLTFTSEDRHIRDAAARCILKILEELSTFYFSSNRKMNRPNKQQKH